MACLSSRDPLRMTSHLPIAKNFPLTCWDFSYNSTELYTLPMVRHRLCKVNHSSPTKIIPIQEFFGKLDLVPLEHLRCVSWSWRISVAFGEHLLTRPTTDSTSRAPPTRAHIQTIHEIRATFDYALLLVRNTVVTSLLEETLAQLRTALVDLLHLIMCSLAYGNQFPLAYN